MRNKWTTICLVEEHFYLFSTTYHLHQEYLWTTDTIYQQLCYDIERLRQELHLNNSFLGHNYSFVPKSAIFLPKYHCFVYNYWTITVISLCICCIYGSHKLAYTQFLQLLYHNHYKTLKINEPPLLLILIGISTNLVQILSFCGSASLFVEVHHFYFIFTAVKLFFNWSKRKWTTF